MNVLDLMRDLVAAHGPSGDEGNVAQVIAKYAAPFADEVRTDTLGNLIVRKKGTGPKIMFSAHMDSIGFIVTHIEKEGFLRVGAIGGIPKDDALHAVVRFKNGTRGVVACSEDVERTKITVSDLYLDIGAEREDAAKELVQIGDTAVYDGAPFTSGNRIVSPYLDDRIACAILLLALEKLGGSDNDLYFVFSTQEEVGTRGAKTAAYGIDPDYGIAVDVTATCDRPGTKRVGSTKLGGGAGVKVMDASVTCLPAVIATLEALADASGIAHQRDVLRAGGTDAGVMLSTKTGVWTGGISIPTRYIHAPAEMADLRDIDACVNLVCAFAEAKLDKDCKGV